MGAMPTDDAWCALSATALDVAVISDWVVQPDCGATVVFTGTARDHASGRVGVTRLDYEAYEEHALPRLAAVADEVRARWPVVGRVALHHRVGEVPVGEAAVVVAVATPHRAEAFEAARWAIDTLKATVPIWKKEFHSGGESWGTEAQHLEAIPQAGLPGPPATTPSRGG
jgi:molybdopterin synthase catalytic subunit